MNIQIKCEKCGHGISVPRDAAGKYAPCPSCANSVYIPTPEEEIEELPLAEEDPTDLEREAALLAERRRLDMQLAREEKAAGHERSPGHDSGAGSGRSSESPPLKPPSAGQHHPPGTGRTTVKGVVIAYLTAMRDSDLTRAEQALALLHPYKTETLRVLDRLAADQIPPTEMADVPPGVFQGFLKSLRSQL